MTTGTDILLIVDHKWRDLPGMAALQVWLKDAFGCKTEMALTREWSASLARYRPKAIVLPHMNGEHNVKIARTAQEMGTRVVVIQTEGRPNNIETMEYTAGRFADMRFVDLWFTWSKTVRDFMLERQVLSAEKLIVGGVHRFDVYRPDLNQLLTPRPEFARKYDLDPQRPIVSWATNFTYAKFHGANQDFLLQDWQRLGMTKLPSLADPLDFAHRDWEAREQALAAVGQLMRARPEAQFILKPHPAEELDRYQEFVAECRRAGLNITLVFQEYIWDILNAADVHIHRLCTTGVEAWLLDVPSLELHLSDYGSWNAKIPGAAAEAMKGNDVVADAEHLLERVNFYLSGGQPTATQLAARKQYIERWLYRVDGQRCCEHAYILSELIRDRKNIKPFPVNELSWRMKVNFSLNRLLRRPPGAQMRFWQSGKSSRVDFIGQVDKSFSPQDAQLWTQRAREALKGQVEDYQRRKDRADTQPEAAR